MFRDLLDHPGVREIVELRSRFGFLAFHGGSLEEMTERVAEDAAERSGASLYAVVQPPDLRWHIPSAVIGATSSDGLDAFLDHVDVAVAVHGFGRDGLWTTLLLGGGNRTLAGHVAGCLRSALPEYAVVDELDAIPAALRGLHPDNPANRPSGGGVQLELPPRVRGMGPHWRDFDGPGLTPHTEALVSGLATAALSWDGSGPLDRQ
jgi:phage replication-related protein YjqB (UPF0714/DUF867 family)